MYNYRKRYCQCRSALTIASEWSICQCGSGCDETPHRPHRQEITALAPKTTSSSMAAAADDWTLALVLTLTLELVVLGAGVVISCLCGRCDRWGRCSVSSHRANLHWQMDHSEAIVSADLHWQ